MVDILSIRFFLFSSNSNIQSHSLEPLYEVIVVPGDERMENPTYATHSIKMEKNPAYSLINTKDS